jgi:hypothetical protein
MSLLDRSLNVDISREIQQLAEIREFAQETAVACSLGGEMKNAIANISHLDWWGCGSALSVSSHIMRIREALQRTLEIFGKCLAESHYRAIIELIGSKLINNITDAIYSAKPISDIGAQQLIVDVAEVKAILLEVPKKTHQTYIELVTKRLHRLEISLKVLSSPACGDKVSMKAILDSLDPNLGQSSTTALDKEVDRLLNLRKGPTGGSTIHAFAPGFFGSSLASSAEAAQEAFPIESKNSADLSPPRQNTDRNATHAAKTSKPDIRAEMSKFGASLMNNKLFGRK